MGRAPHELPPRRHARRHPGQHRRRRRSPATCAAPGTAWKVKRIRNEPRIEVAACTPRGRPTGPAVAATARRVGGEGARRAARALRRKHPVLQGVLAPLAHRAMRCGTAHFEVRPMAG